MHREVREHIEDVLAHGKASAARQHLSECLECRDEVSGMTQQSELLQELKTPESFDATLRPGFYARVMERIEAEGPISIWNLFIESAFGRRLALASMALALVMGVYLFTLERSGEEPTLADNGSQSQGLPENGSLQEPIAAMPVSQVDGIGGFPMQAGDPFDAEMNQMVNEMNQMMLQMQQSGNQDGVLSDLVTYREQ